MRSAPSSTRFLPKRFRDVGGDQRGVAHQLSGAASRSRRVARSASVAARASATSASRVVGHRNVVGCEVPRTGAVGATGADPDPLAVLAAAEGVVLDVADTGVAEVERCVIAHANAGLDAAARGRARTTDDEARHHDRGAIRDRDDIASGRRRDDAVSAPYERAARFRARKEARGIRPRFPAPRLDLPRLANKM
jgi:hypothetical protein